MPSNKFDWEFYLNYYPDLKKQGIDNKNSAKRHYMMFGIKEGRVYNQDMIIKNTNKEYKINKNITINILIRNTYRPNYFKKCIDSILAQTYQNYKIIMCYDDNNCLDYLNEYMNNEKIKIFKAPNLDKSQSYFYNLYCNELLNHVKEGWIMFLDDDDMFNNINALDLIVNNIKNEYDFLIWKVKLGKIIIFPPNINNIQFGQISGIGFCFNSIYKNYGKWYAQQGSDYKYISELLNNNKSFNRKPIDYVLTSTQHNTFGQCGLKEQLYIKNLPMESIYTDNDYSMTNFDTVFDLNNFKKKIYIISWTNSNIIKGINIDTEIIYNYMEEIGFDIKILYIPITYLKQFDTSNNEIFLDRDIYIFSEVCFADIYDYLFKKNKEIICIPNIDSYSTNKAIIKDRETDFINMLIKYSNNDNFSLWCKTHQIYDWLKIYNLPNLHYIHFNYKIKNNKKYSVDNNILNIFIESKNYILLDTGDSTTKRKYLEELLDIFIENPSIPFILLVKTTPTVYNKFLKSTKYDKKFTNIVYIIQVLSVENLSYIYANVKYFLYISKFDGFGLSLQQAINHELFIFTMDGLPWSELLQSYPRKCLIKCSQDLSKSMGVNIKGKALSQIYYKVDITDLINKLLSNITNYEEIINTTNEQCKFLNIYNEKIFMSNIYNYFQNKYKICSIYNNSAVGVVSFQERGILFIENLLHIITQTNNICAYLNSTNNIIMNLLSNMCNVKIIKSKYDFKSITKLVMINCFCKKYNLIVDDDIIYPQDYVKYTCNILDNVKNKDFLYSFNGYSDINKYPFNIKTLPCKNNVCNLGSGTLFFCHDAINRIQLNKFVKNLYEKNYDKNIGLFCDKTLKNYCDEYNIYRCIISPKYSYWMKNNNKMKIGLLEIKKKNNIYDLHDIQTIELKDTLIDYSNSIPKEILKYFINKINIKSELDINYYNICYNNEKLYIENIKKECIYSIMLDVNNKYENNKKIENLIKWVSKLYYENSNNIIKNRLLVTGGCGFIGSNFINYIFPKQKYEIINLDAMYYCANEKNIKKEIINDKHYHFFKENTNNTKFINNILKTYRIEYVINFAAQSHVQNSFEDSILYTKDNILGTHILLECCRKYGKIKKFIHVSTDEVYGESMLDINENHKTEHSILCPTNPYAATKAGAELIAQSYNHSFKFPVTISRGNNVYGPNQYPEKVIPKFIKQLKENKKITIQGNGSCIRAFLHSYDTATAFELILEKGAIGEIYNIGCDEDMEYSILDIAKILIKKIKKTEDYDKWIEYIEDRPFNDKRYYISNKKLKDLGWKITKDFETGINNLINISI